jgi:XapX domain-containing protein
MKILIAFIVAFGIGAGSRWTGVPSLPPQAIVGAFLIVAVSTGYVSADRLLKRTPSPTVNVASHQMPGNVPGSHGQIAGSSPSERFGRGSFGYASPLTPARACGQNPPGLA